MGIGKIPQFLVIAILLSSLVLVNYSYALSYDSGVKLTASDGASLDVFGHGVSVSGNTLVVGAPGAGQGAAYVFERTAGSGNSWTEVKKLTVSSTSLFGNDVSISADTLAVASPGNAATYVFERDQGGANNWGLAKTLTASGDSVSISGNTLAVGNSGSSVQIFERSPGPWNLAFTIGAPASSVHFGHSVSLDGDSLVIGDTGGAAHVFVRTGTTWSQEDTLTVSAPVPAFFGHSVSISGDTAAVGGPVSNGQGVAYVYDRTGSTWNFVTAVPSSSGQAVSISGDTIVSGSAFTDTAFVNNRDETGANNWGQFTTFSASAGDGFGFSVFNSGPAIAVGAVFSDGQNIESGAAHVFLRDFDMDTVVDLDDNCPNGIIDPGEECDDGNQNNGDVCSNTCLFTTSGQVGFRMNLLSFCGGTAASINPSIVDQDTPPNLELTPQTQVTVTSTGTGAALVTASSTDYINVNGIVRMLASALHFSASATDAYSVMTPMSNDPLNPVVFIQQHLPGTDVIRQLLTLVNYNNNVVDPVTGEPVLQPLTMLVDLVFTCPNTCPGPNQIVDNGVCVDCPPGSTADPVTNTCT